MVSDQARGRQGPEKIKDLWNINEVPESAAGSEVGPMGVGRKEARLSANRIGPTKLEPFRKGRGAQARICILSLRTSLTFSEFSSVKSRSTCSSCGWLSSLSIIIFEINPCYVYP